MIHVAAIILAGGSGLRMGNSLPKQFLKLGDRPILMHTISKFAEAVENCRIIVVLPENHTEYWKDLCNEYGFKIPHITCTGGETRYDSVKNGLQYIENADIVAVHDGVRPFVSHSMIKKAIADARVFGAVIPAVPIVDSLRVVDEYTNKAVDRKNYRIIQSPQVFKTKILTEAYKIPFRETFTDDASVVEANGVKVYLYEGSPNNIKITSPIDMLTGEAILYMQMNAESV